MMLASKLTVIVVTCNSMGVLPSFLERLHDAMAGERCAVVVYDNASEDGVEEFLRDQWPDVSFLGCDENQGYGAAFNRGIVAAATPFVALISPDVAVQPGGLSRLVAFLEERPSAGGVSGPVAHVRDFPSRIEMDRVFPGRMIPVHFGYETVWTRVLYYSGIRTKWARVSLAIPWTTVAAADEISVSRLNGSFGVFRREALIRVGLFDPRLFAYFEEDDVALRLIKRGYRIYVTERTVVIHLSGRGSAASLFTRGKILLNSQYVFFRKHYGLLYAGMSFFLIWALLGLVGAYGYCLFRPHRKITAGLWRWHLRSVLCGGGVPAETIPGLGKRGVNYRWLSRM